MDILQLMSTITVRVCLLAHCLVSQIQRPIKKPTTRLGNEYIQNVLTEDPEHFRGLYRLYPDVFLICVLFSEKKHL